MMNAPFSTPAMMAKGAITVAAITACRDAGMTKAEAVTALGCSLATLSIRSKAAGIKWPRGRRHGSSGNPLASRFSPRPVTEHASRGMPAAGNPAFTERRTIYPATRAAAGTDVRVLISGFNSHKIGDEIRKGRWKGFPVYTITLEERATCPTSCAHWRSCFGNQMHFARRLIAGADYEAALTEEILDAGARHPGGFAVRVHVLGDFYSVAYVALWRWLLDTVPQLHVFGFSARIDRGDPIARSLVELVLDRWDRFAIRFSNAPIDECSTVSIEHPLQRPPDAVICPQQLGKTANCSNCGFCWQSRRRVAFLRH